MGVNVLLFMVFQIGVEPWRRKRLVKGFEDKVMEALEREGSVPGATSGEMQVDQRIQTTSIEEENVPRIANQEPLGDVLLPVEEIALANDADAEVLSGNDGTSSPVTPISRLESMKESLRDMFSERQITVRRVDLTTAMLEGTAAGVAFVGVLVLLLRPR